MVFQDISFLEMIDLESLKSLITNPTRERGEIGNFRSAMMINPLKIKHINKIDEVDADVVILNLEDGIAKEQKQKALYLTALFLSNLKSSKTRVVVRVNPLNGGGDEEIKLLNEVKPDAIRVAKIRELKEVENALKLIDNDIDLHLSIETKEAFANLKNINLNSKVKACYLGILDLLTDLEISQQILTYKNPTIRYILSKFLIDCKIAGVFPVGFTYQDYNNIEGFKEWCKLEKSIGYRSTSCLGPKQVEIANSIFVDEDHSIQRAKDIKERFEARAKEGITGFMDDDYGFIDEPIYKDALLILQKI